MLNKKPVYMIIRIFFFLAFTKLNNPVMLFILLYQ
jgi:hypothetical protein